MVLAAVYHAATHQLAAMFQLAAVYHAVTNQCAHYLPEEHVMTAPFLIGAPTTHAIAQSVTHATDPTQATTTADTTPLTATVTNLAIQAADADHAQSVFTPLAVSV